MSSGLNSERIKDEGSRMKDSPRQADPRVLARGRRDRDQPTAALLGQHFPLLAQVRGVQLEPCQYERCPPGADGVWMIQWNTARGVQVVQLSTKERRQFPRQWPRAVGSLQDHQFVEAHSSRVLVPALARGLDPAEGDVVLVPPADERPRGTGVPEVSGLPLRNL